MSAVKPDESALWRGLPSGAALRSWLGGKIGIRRSGARGERLLLLLAILTGVLSGLAVAGFRLTVEWVHLAFLEPALRSHHPALILIPALAGLIIAVLTLRVFPTIRSSGVNQTKAALYVYDGYVSVRSGVGKFIAASLAIGSGHSVGPEDPSLHIGAAIGSWIGRKIRLSREHLRLMAPIGAVAGLTAAFNAPLSAVIFVIEEMTGRWSSLILGAGLLSALASVVVARSILGSESLFHIDVLVVLRPQELLAYAGIGVAGGLASAAFSAMVIFLRSRLMALPRWTLYFQPAVSGLLIGLIAYFGAPQVMGAGYEVIERATQGHFPWLVLGILAVLKMLATTLSITSGVPGGIFAPTLFVGAMLGGAVGGAEQALFPDLVSTTGTNALIGMGALFAGFLRVPFTSMLMVVEVCDDYSIVLPVMIASTLAYLIARALQPVPIFDQMSRQDGLRLPSMEAERDATILRVEDAMMPPPAVVLSGSETVASALERLEGLAEEGVLVHDVEAGWRVAESGALRSLAERGESGAQLITVYLGEDLPRVHPDHSLDSALRHTVAWSVLPVVHRGDATSLEGVLTLEGVLRSYGGKSPAS
jgi:CIC family chloride channel protein